MMINRIKHTAIVMLATVAAVCSGCHSDSPAPVVPEEPDMPDPDQLTLCLNVSFDNSNGTRAENDPDGYEGPTGDFEKISTIRVIIVRSLNADKTQGIVEANRLVATTDAGRPIYDNLEFKVIANENKRIYLIANEEFLTPPASFTSSINPTASKFLDTYRVDKDNAADLTTLTNWTVSLPSIPASGIVTRGLFSTLDVANPQNDQYNGRLPLTEVFDNIFVDRNKAVDEICYSHLFLTRTAAKARFFLDVSDNFKNDDAVMPVIESISLSGIGTREYVFPNNATYSPSKTDLIGSSPSFDKKIDNYINNFNTPSNATTVTYQIKNINEKVVAIPDDEVEYFDQEKTKRLGKSITNTFYFPESILDNGEMYTVTVKLTNGTVLSAPLNTNILQIAGKGNAIARNTYLPIVIKFDGAMDITVSVRNWSSVSYEFDFSDHVGMSNDGAVSFIENTYAENGFDKTTGRLVLRDYPNATTGSFTIGSPVGHRWDAYLITTQGEMNAIQFVTKDAQGNNVYTDHLSGTIGQPVTFNVAATMSAGNQQREAVLQVMATLDYGGISVPVNILEGGQYGDGTENITFIQNAR